LPAAAVYMSESKSTGKTTVQKTAQVAERYVVKGGVAEVAKKGVRNRFVPDAKAIGAHTIFRRDPLTGKVSHYETFRPQTNLRNPNPWESVKRFDGPQHVHYHFNKITKERVYCTTYI